MRDIDEGFPLDSVPYTECYDYMSDSDLEDEFSCFEEDEEKPDRSGGTGEPTRGDEPEPLQGLPDSDSQALPTTTPESLFQTSQKLRGVKDIHRLAPIPLNSPTILANFGCRPNNGSVRLGKVAIIRDMAAVTYAKPAAD